MIEEKLKKWIAEEFGRQRARLDYQNNQMQGMAASIGRLIRSVAELEVLMDKLTTKRQRTAARKKVQKSAEKMATARQEMKPGELTPDEMMKKYGGLSP